MKNKRGKRRPSAAAIFWWTIAILLFMAVLIIGFRRQILEFYDSILVWLQYK
jgi:hypothetical protein